MDISITPSIFQLILSGIYVALLGTGVYLTVLVIKALRTYIKKNS